MIKAFGPRATAYARRLAGDLRAIITDVDNLGNAFLEAVAWRERGEPFYAMVLHEDRRAALAASVATQLLSAVADHDARLSHFRAYAQGQLGIDDRPASQVWAEERPEVTVAAPDFFALADAMLVRSSAEGRRWADRLTRFRPLHRVLGEPTLPAVECAPGSSRVVVWAPDEEPQSYALAAFATSEIPVSVTVVGAGDALPRLPNVRFLAADDPAVLTALAGAVAVVCPDVGDPGPAVAFARRGYGVAATLTSGAAEFINGAGLYDGASARSLIDAIGIALARPAVPRAPIGSLSAVPVVPAAPIPRDQLPLATILIVNRNAPDALASAEAQTYPNLEIVVLSDGAALEDVLARSHGAYLQVLGDDSVLYPDHVERLVFAMLRSGVGAAHANTLIRYQKRSADGGYVTTGFNAQAFANATIADQSIMLRRDVFEAIGGWTIQLQSRLAQHSPVVWVDQVTSELRVRGEAAIPPRITLNAG